METLINYLIDICVITTCVGIGLVIPCYLLEKICLKFNLKDKIVNLLSEEN